MQICVPMLRLLYVYTILYLFILFHTHSHFSSNLYQDNDTNVDLMYMSKNTNNGMVNISIH